MLSVLRRKLRCARFDCYCFDVTYPGFVRTTEPFVRLPQMARLCAFTMTAIPRSTITQLPAVSFLLQLTSRRSCSCVLIQHELVIPLLVGTLMTMALQILCPLPCLKSLLLQRHFESSNLATYHYALFLFRIQTALLTTTTRYIHLSFRNC